MLDKSLSSGSEPYSTSGANKGDQTQRQKQNSPKHSSEYEGILAEQEFHSFADLDQPLHTEEQAQNDRYASATNRIPKGRLQNPYFEDWSPSEGEEDERARVIP